MHSGIEMARLVALVAVISLHANAYGIFGDDRAIGFVVDELCRFAVPVFFLISGYLWKDDSLAAPVEPLLRLFRRLLVPFVIWVAFYTFCEISQVFYPGTFPNPASIRSYIFIPLSGGAGFHLWFLPALFIGTALGWFAVRRVGLKGGLALSATLYLVGTALALYARSRNFDAIVWIYRNGLFFAPLFLVLGHAMKKGRIPAIPMLAALVLAGAAIHIAEGWYVFDRFPKGHDMSLGTVPLAVGVFGLFLHMRAGADPVVPWGRDVFGAYLAHLFFLRLFAAQVGQRGVGAALACIAFTLIVSLLFSRLMKRSAVTRPLVS
ncbi:acyltransferase [Labrys monachus]|uniref:acyltransferase n=1 Tax=Labrys monachus TaxID=217067 RepID=UPI0027D7CBA2|nr:acyltransferase family protein [Labrys monachus]